MCSTTVELSVIVPSASPRISQSRPRGESASICPSGPYVGHVGRQKPQCVHASISSRSITQAKTPCGSSSARSRSSNALGTTGQLLSRPRAHLVPDLGVGRHGADQLLRRCRPAPRQPRSCPRTAAPTRSSVTSSALGTRVERRTTRAFASASPADDDRRRGLGQRVQPQAHADDDRRACRASRERSLPRS